MILLWSVSFALAVAPLVMPSAYFGQHFYGTNGVCLSLHIHDPFAQVISILYATYRVLLNI